MKYYKVVRDGVHDYFTGYTTIKNELVTLKERNTKFRYLKDDIFEEVDINRNKTFWCFGARFERKENNNEN